MNNNFPSFFGQKAILFSIIVTGQNLLSVKSIPEDIDQGKIQFDSIIGKKIDTKSNFD